MQFYDLDCIENTWKNKIKIIYDKDDIKNVNAGFSSKIITKGISNKYHNKYGSGNFRCKYQIKKSKGKYCVAGYYLDFLKREYPQEKISELEECKEAA